MILFDKGWDLLERARTKRRYRMKKIMMVLFVLFFVSLFCEDVRVFIDDGTTIEGALIDERADVFFVATDGMLNKIPKERITQIDNIRIIRVTERPNIKLLPLSFLAFAVGYDFFCEYNDLKKIEPLPNSLRSQKNRKFIMGTICILTGVGNTFIAVKEVSIETRVDYIGLRVKF